MTDERNIEGARKAATLLLQTAKRGGAFTKSKGRDLARENMFRNAQFSHLDPKAAAYAVNLALQGDEDAMLAVNTAIVGCMIAELPIPIALQPYLICLLDHARFGPRKPGVKPHGNFARDQWIIAAIRAVAQYGFAPTRSPATALKNPASASACSVVADELRRLGFHISESALNSIWTNRRLSD